MMKNRVYCIGLLVLALGIAALPGPPPLRAGSDSLPSKIDDQDFWKMTEQFSEPNGYFRSDNLLSNERWMQYVIPELLGRTPRSGVYMGVGPEQNFTYIAALKPKVAFITDIRRGNMHTHLMYKALFELASDRVDFVSRLFSRKPPEGLKSSASGQEIFNAFYSIQSGDPELFKENLKAVQKQLTEKHKFALTSDDLAGIEYVYSMFFTYGPGIHYNSSGQGFGGRGGNFATYADLMTDTDGNGVNRSYLANDDIFKVVRELEERNLIVPVVGDFAGPKAIRAVGKYLKEHEAIVTAFYLSNVEQYLSNWNTFCGNISSLPLDEKSTFIRAVRGGGGPGGGLVTALGSMLSETRGCAGYAVAAR